MSDIRRKLLADSKEEILFDGVTMYFSDPFNGWYLEDNINGNDEYYLIGDGIKIKLDARSTWQDHYIAFTRSQLLNTTLKVYYQPNIMSQKGTKRREVGLIKIDLSTLPNKSYWYFWDTLVYDNLQQIIFPTIFKTQYIMMRGSFNNIVIPATNQAILNLDSSDAISYQSSVTHNNIRYYTNTSSSSTIDKIISLFPTNITKGVMCIGTATLSVITLELRDLITAKNITIRNAVNNSVFLSDWSLP